MRRAVVVAATIVAILIGATAGYLIGSTNGRTVTSVSTITSVSTTQAPPITVTSTLVATTTATNTVTTAATSATRFSPYAAMLTENNLKIELSLNGTRVPLGGSITVSINVTNTLGHPSHLESEVNWPVQGLAWPPLGNCGTEVSPVGTAMFKGLYTSTNISSGRALYLYNPVLVYCPNWSPYNGFLFETYSNRASTGDTYFVDYASNSINGSFSGANQFARFSAGTYTVVAGDEWGDILFLYFTVG